ncbi:TIGR04222 domain-containing membrane protein [Amycolatopsis rhizosphaerae]|uniref:TIGR04222 domain-containing membrane protein n=1 Tax=Amycolatopsis rhizosphaerae TaxID=2053003 RepID=A0A558B0D0_9PSEU|nr:TIGR04222 domain-containing membrane protein [Amycolatopsis rhizosphaerae]TVT29961.1 TIGR04222 domain-containing membrane protein [Amycolatopsis rhizosphaerae]
MEPWGLSGPAFLGVYAGSLVVALVLTALLRRRKPWRRVRAGQQPLSLWETAYLTGGPERVVDSAIASLIRQERLRARSYGLLQPIGDALPADPVERAVFEAVSAAQRLSLTKTRKEAGRRRAVRAVEASLARRGLLVRSRLDALFTASPVFAVAAVGVARLVNGIRLHRPVGLLVVFLLVTGAVLFFLLRRPSPRHTRAGLKARQAALRPGPTPVPLPALAGAVGPVVLGGLAAYPDTVIKTALFHLPPTGIGGSSSSGSSSCGSSSSSCSSSSGSSCGSGCGGGCGG